MNYLVSRLVANLPLVLLSLAMVIGGIWAYRLWKETHEEEEGAEDSPLGLLDQIRAAHAAGEIDDAEYERVRQRLFKIGPEGSTQRRSGLAARNVGPPHSPTAAPEHENDEVSEGPDSDHVSGESTSSPNP